MPDTLALTDFRTGLLTAFAEIFETNHGYFLIPAIGRDATRRGN